MDTGAGLEHPPDLRGVSGGLDVVLEAGESTVSPRWMVDVILLRPERCGVVSSGGPKMLLAWPPGGFRTLRNATHGVSGNEVGSCRCGLRSRQRRCDMSDKDAVLKPQWQLSRLVF